MSPARKCQARAETRTFERRAQPVRRVPPSGRTREAIRRLFEEGLEGNADSKSEIMQLAMRLILEEVLEAKVRDLLGRGYYERRTGEAGGYRNGYREAGLRTAEGAVRFAVPQVRDTEASGLAELRESLKGRTGALEQLAVEMYARGCSTRDIEQVFRGEDGQLLLSRTAVSELTEALWAEYEEFATRDLSEIRPLFLFLDGLAERLRPGAKREAILAAWAISWEEKKVLIAVAPGTKESADCCKDFLADLKRRGLGDPVLTITDGAPGLIRAVEDGLPTSLRQRCLAHKMRNIVAKLPEEARVEFRQAARAAYEAPSPAMARALREDLVARFGKLYPSAVQCFEEDFEACIAHLRLPPNHRRATRTTNLLERLFVEERRRLRAVVHVFGERPVPKLMTAVSRTPETGMGPWGFVRLGVVAMLGLSQLKFPRFCGRLTAFAKVLPFGSASPLAPPGGSATDGPSEPPALPVGSAAGHGLEGRPSDVDLEHGAGMSHDQVADPLEQPAAESRRDARGRGPVGSLPTRDPRIERTCRDGADGGPGDVRASAS